VPLSASPCSATGQPVLVGNPFMAHLDFDKFLTDNNTSTSQIYNGYKLATGVNSGADGKVNSFISYQKVGETWFSTNPDPDGSLDDLANAPLIAPMQSFIVISKIASPSLVANVKSTTTSTVLKDTLRSAFASESELRSSSPSSPVRKLNILAVRGSERSKALLLYPGNASNNYNPEEDSYRLFPEGNESPLLVYTRSIDGYALDINSIGNFEEIVPLGIHTSLKGDITLQFSGTATFGDKVYLHDTKTSQIIDLSRQNEYTFTKNDDALYLEDRFYLSFNSPTDIEIVKSSSISVISSSHSIDIISKDNTPIQSIRIADIQGRYLLNEERLSVVNYHYSINTPGIYIIQITTGDNTETKKVVVK
jgi:hypothetical protein